MKVKYIGESLTALPQGAIREVISIEKGLYRIMTDCDETHLLPPQLFTVVEDNDISAYAALLDKQVRVICTDGDIVGGVWIDWTSEQDNEPDPESITIETPCGDLIEIFVCEIKAIAPSP